MPPRFPVPARSVAWDVRVDLLGPEVDPALQAEGVGDAPVAEEAGGLGRAHAVVAVDDDGAFRGSDEGRGVVREAGEGQEGGAPDAA